MATQRAIRQFKSYSSRGMTEKVSFHPSGDRARTIYALIDRQGFKEANSTITEQIEITVLNDPVEGIEIEHLDRGLDTIEVPIRFGEGPVEKRIFSILFHDENIARLMVK